MLFLKLVQTTALRHKYIFNQLLETLYNFTIAFQF